MSLLWTIIISVIITIILAIIVGVVVFKLVKKADDAIDDFQRKINKLENCFAEAGSSWMSDLLADIVVGDEAATIHKLREFIESQNVPLFFLDKVAVPCAMYAFREASPEQWSKLKREFQKNAPDSAVSAS